VEYLLDTNHASPLVTLPHPLRVRVLQAIRSGDTFAVTTVNLTELLFGIGLTPRAVHNTLEWERWRASLDVYRVEEEDAVRAAQLQVSLRHHGRQLKTVDALIAAIALRYHLIVLTSDSDFDIVPDLQCENWLTSRP
jgi:predicted nucleic acid-binding protein